nr:hypothetical protein [Kofleriaceae bacterium]
MRKLFVCAALLLAGCITSTLKSSGGHIDSAKAALDKGDLNQAEAEYLQAGYRSEGNQWAIAESTRGIAQVGIARLKLKVPELRKLTTPPAEAIATVVVERKNLRGFGGDAELDKQLVIIIGEHAERWILAEEGRVAQGSSYIAAHAITQLLSVRDLPASIIARAIKLRATAGKQAQLRASAAGTAHPITQRFHLGHAAALGISEIGDGRELLGPYARSVTLDLKAAQGCPSDALRADIAIPGTTRRAAVTVELTSCTKGTSTSTSTDIATWQDQVLDGYKTESVPEQVCETKCGSVLTGGEVCNISYAYNPPMAVCTPNTLTKCSDVCKTVQVARQVPNYRPVERKEQRTLTTQTTTARITGTWKVTREGAERSGTFDINERNEYGGAPAVGRAPQKIVGIQRSESDLADAAYRSMRSRLQSALDQLFAADVAEAVAAAQRAAGKIDDEEEQWARSVLLGGSDLGPLAQRYDVDRVRFLELFGPQKFAPVMANELPPAIEQPPTVSRIEGAQVVADDYDELAADYLPSLGGRYWLTFEAGYRALPTVMTSGGSEAGGDSALLPGIRGGTKVLGFVLKQPYWGVQFVDELSGALALGGRVGGPTVIDNSLSFAAATFSAHYQLGAGIRKPGKGAFFGGVRATYEGFLLGTSTGSYTTVPLFVRAELPLIYGSLAVEATGVSLSGGSNVGLSVHWANLRRWSLPSPSKYFQLRIERTTVDATSTDFGDTAASKGERLLNDVALTSVVFLYGR